MEAVQTDGASEVVRVGFYTAFHARHPRGLTPQADGGDASMKTAAYQGARAPLGTPSWASPGGTRCLSTDRVGGTGRII